MEWYRSTQVQHLDLMCLERESLELCCKVTEWITLSECLTLDRERVAYMDT